MGTCGAAGALGSRVGGWQQWSCGSAAAALLRGGIQQYLSLYEDSVAAMAVGYSMANAAGVLCRIGHWRMMAPSVQLILIAYLLLCS